MRKEVNTLFDDESGVSPVIGVILMVAITVILAAVIGTMVMDMTKNVGDATPTADFDIEDHADAYGPNDAATPDGAYQISHSTGNDVQMKNIQVLVKTADGTTIARLDGTTNTVTTDANTVELQYNGSPASTDQTISVGDSLTLVQTADDGATTPGDVFTNNLADYQIQIVYTAGDSGSTLAEATVALS